MLHVLVIGGAAEFCLDREHAAIGAFHDQVDLPFAAEGAEVPDTGL
jgi:hypothetical protein